MSQADMIFFNGDIVTVNSASPLAEALAVRDGRVAAVGNQADVFELKGSATEMIDLAGQTLMPGLIEPHSHPILSASYYDWIDLSGFNNPDAEAVFARLHKAAAETEPGQWITGFGYDPILIPELKALNADRLDEVSTVHPIFVMTQPMHTCYVNHAALDAANVTRDTPQPALGGEIVTDENGEPTGMLIEGPAFIPFMMAAGQKTANEILKLVEKQVNRYARAGYTTVGAAGLFPVFQDAPGVLQRVVESAGSPIRMRVMNRWENMEAGLAASPGEGSDRFMYTGVKFWYDGSPYTGTMFLDEPYLDSDMMQDNLGLPKNNRGKSIHTKEALEKHVQKYHDQGWQIIIHGQGDRAVRDILDIYEAVINRSPRSDHRHRIEHCALIPLDQLERTARLGVALSWHINHVYYYGEALKNQIVGPARAARLMPMGTANRHGIVSSLHNDSPMYPAEPLKLMRTAVTRKTRDNLVIGADHAVSVEDAVKAVTIDAAWQMFMEDKVGSLEVGKFADLALLSQNPHKVDPDEIDKIEVKATYLAGRKN